MAMSKAHRWPRAVFFDVGETLVRARHPYGELLADLGRGAGLDLPLEAIDGLAAHVDTCVLARSQQRLPFTFPAAESQRFWLETYQGFLARYLTDTDALRLASAYRDLLSSNAGYALYEDTVPALARLREEGYPLGIISNWEAWLPSLLDQAGLTPFFSHITISGLCGVEKPDPGIFRRALQESGYQPGEIVYVGDRPAHDVEPAFALGILPILLDRTDRYLDDPTYQRIASLGDLPITLERLRCPAPRA